MAREDMVVMRTKELVRWHVIEKVMAGEMGQVEAGRMLRMSERQVRRLVRRVEREGERGVIHKSRGRRSNRAYEETLKRRVVKLYGDKYAGFGPTLYGEKLEEREGIELGRETIRRWLKEARMWEGCRKRRRHHRWRERRSYVGEMVQIDGSHHEWLEKRGPKLVLMSYVDDATGRVFARFYEYEGTKPAMESFGQYARRFGLPASAYLDNHSTYKSQAEPSIEERLAGRRPKSQFERALEELGVEVIHSHSAQARGRVERSFRTLQDRLVKEMRLEGIASLAEANEFLASYLPAYNRRFAKAVSGDVHRAIPAEVDLNHVLSIQTKRVVRHDGTVMHERVLYELLESIRPKSVVVEEHLSGAIHLTYQRRRFKYRVLAARPAAPTPPRPAALARRSSAAGPNHPWRTQPAVLPTTR